jgi:hypothetical protein
LGFQATEGIKLGSLSEDYKAQTYALLQGGYIYASTRSTGLKIDVNLTPGPLLAGMGGADMRCCIASRIDDISIDISIDDLLANAIIERLVSGTDR